MLLKHGFLEAENRLDAYEEAVDNVKITGYGLYMLKELHFVFSYLDIICTDTGVFSEEVSNFLTEAAKKEYTLFVKNERTERVRTRLDRVEHFIAYLSEEEKREREFYHLEIPDEELFTTKCSVSFASERQKVLASAQRQNRLQRRQTR